MADSWDLRKLGPNAFEHMVNALALRILGAGTTGFGPASDGGRDGYFEGVAPYPAEGPANARWNGIWYIQSKFHSGEDGNGQKWLLDQVRKELEAFSDPMTKRRWPDNWIVATNVDPSGVPETGAFDRLRRMVSEVRPSMNFHVWGGRKILDLLIAHHDVADRYGHFLTPGEVLAALRNALTETRTTVDQIIWNLVVARMVNHEFSKLEQAGGAAGEPPGLHQIFVDLPIAKDKSWQYESESRLRTGHAVEMLLQTSARSHRASEQRHVGGPAWRSWRNDPRRSGVWFVRGGPGQGKSTVGQYFAQLQRAAIVLSDGSLNTGHSHRTLAEAIRKAATKANVWPTAPRIPIVVELKEFAQWAAAQADRASTRLITYLASELERAIGEAVFAGTILRALAVRSWFVMFDGLDEVPHDMKDRVASEVTYFIENQIVEIDADVLACCTSRPQGYSGQFSRLDCAAVFLPLLEPEEALRCATPLLFHKRTAADGERDAALLEQAIRSESIRQLMTTPLQSHIMAIVVREGGKPPDRRWQLFRNFYEVIRRREATHGLPDASLTALLHNKQQLLKLVHDRLGFALHARAEKSAFAETQMHRNEFETLVRSAVAEVDEALGNTVQTVMEATTVRLVLVNTPDDGDHVRFDVRQLQEFFAGEYIYEDLAEGTLQSRLELLDGDSHWREVIHFLLSAVVETRRQMELPVIILAIVALDRGLDETTSTLIRRLCRGSLAVLRLLAEGVLEEDARVRARFDGTLSSAFASSEAEVVAMLIAPRLQKSRNWLINAMVEAFERKRPEELVGAAIALVLRLFDGDPRVAAVVTAWKAAPASFLGLVARRIFDVLPIPPDFPKWFLLLLLKTFEADTWTTLSPATLHGMMRALQWSDATAEQAALVGGWSVTDAALLRWALTRTETMDVDSMKLVRLNHYQNDWRRGIPGDPIGTYASSPPPATLFGRIIHAIVRFGTVHDPHTLRQLVDVLWTVPLHAIEALPKKLSSQIPIDWADDAREQLQALRSADDDELWDLIRDERFRGRHVPRLADRVVPAGFDYSSGDWDRLVSDQPSVALLTMSDLYWKRESLLQPKALEKPPVVRLLSALFNRPQHLLAAPGLWGQLMYLRPKDELKIRQAIATVAHQPVRASAFDTELYAFLLRLPGEANLLPHLVVPLLRNHGQGEIRDRVRNMVALPEVLKRLTADQSRSNAVRLAANLLYRVHPGVTEVEDIGVILDLLSSDVLPWFLPTLVTYVDRCVGDAPTARCLVSAVLHAIRSEFDTRELLDPILARWRETSSAPVTKARVLERWLPL